MRYRHNKEKQENTRARRINSAVLTTGSWIVICLGLLVGCATATRQKDLDKGTYLLPQSRSFQTKTNVKSNFDSVWNAALAYLSDEGMTLNSADKSSGLIVAEKYFGKTPTESPLYDPGQVKIERITTMETLKPYGMLGSANKNYVRQYGKIVDSKQTVSEIAREDAKYPVTCRATVALKKTDSNGTSVDVKLSALPLANVLGDVAPKPLSTGKFEAGLLNHFGNLETAK